MTLERGALLHKRYRIVEILGQGGMGSVYRAVDENLGVDVAVKENLFTTDEYARQFRLEAVILANLRHPNLPRVTDHFVIGDQGQYLVMDYIEGEDLRQRMERMGNVTEDDAILIGAAICDALAYLHTRKPPILHRDLKPGNVKITPDGHIFLVDFGLAKVLHGSQATTTGARAMTPGYSPPEQYGTARTDSRTDIYSLGATLYAALSGIIPEDGLARAMDNTQLTPLRKRNSKVSRRLAATIERAMGIDPADRFQTAEEFKRSLLGSKTKTQRLPGEYIIEPAPGDVVEDFRQSAIEKASEPSVVDHKSVIPKVSAAGELPVFKPKRRRRKNRRFVPLLLGALLLLSFGIVAFVRLRPGDVPPQMKNLFAPIMEFELPTNWGFSLPAPVGTPTSQQLPTVTPLTAQPTATATTVVLTQTAPPTTEITPTVENLPGPLATALGGGTGQILFASTRSGIPQLYLAKADGTDLTQLTIMEQGACQASWSPDGLQLVFISPCLGRADFFETIYNESSLYVINADGTGLDQLTAAPGSDFEPAWSPDGTRIAFTSVRGGFRQIYSLDIESREVTLLTNTTSAIESSQPSWSPDGSKIAYLVKRVGAYQIWSMNANGQEAVQITRSGQDIWDYLPSWSTDGRTVFFNQRRPGVRPWLMQLDSEDPTQEPRRLNFVTPMEDVSVSADGYWLVFEGMDSEGNREIYYMTVAGSGRTRLTNDPKIDFDPVWRPLQTP